MRQPRDSYDVAFYMPWIGPLLAPQAELPAGGAETQVLLLARALARRGMRVCILAFDVPGTAIPRSIDGIDVYVRPAYLGKQPRVARVREAASIRTALASVDSPTVVTRGRGPHVGLVALFAKLQRRRFVYAATGPLDFDPGRAFPRSRDRILFRTGIRLADEVVVQTEDQRQLCLARFRREPRLVRSVAEPAAPAAQRPDAFLWIGRTVPLKRPLELVRLARAVPEARFAIVAVPAPEPGGRALFAELARAVLEVPNVEWLPPRSRAELLELIAGSVAVVSTSELEGMPNVFLEAWARGVPAIAFEHDPDGIVERERLGGVAHGSRQALADLVRELWSTRGDHRALRERCRRYVAEWHSPEAVAAEWESIVRAR